MERSRGGRLSTLDPDLGSDRHDPPSHSGFPGLLHAHVPVELFPNAATGMVLRRPYPAFTGDGGHMVCGVNGGSELPAFEIHAPKPGHFKTQLLGHLTGRGALDRLHARWAVWNRVVFSLSVAPVLAGCMEPLGYLDLFHRFGHPGCLLDYLDLGPSASYCQALFPRWRIRSALLDRRRRIRSPTDCADLHGQPGGR